MSEQYNVVFKGEILEGFDPNEVCQNFAKAFKLELQQAEKYFSGKAHVLKKETDHKTAYRFKAAIEKMGANAELRRVDIKPTSSLDNLSLVPIEGRDQENKVEEPSVIPSNTSHITSSCPKCGTTRGQGEECASCGIVFEKFLSKQAALNTESNANDQSEDQPQPSSGDATSIFSTHDNMNKNALIAACIAGLMGAYIWKFVAVVFDFEFGLIAWAIGGAIGFSAAFAGARGKKAGAICASLALVAIFAGKFMAYSVIFNQMFESFASDASFIESMSDSAKERAQEYFDVVYDDESKRQYIFENGYSEASTVGAVTIEEIEIFDESVLPTFESIVNDETFFSDSMEGILDNAVDSGTVLDAVLHDLDWLDFIFLFLGITTAYRLGYQGVRQPNI